VTLTVREVELENWLPYGGQHQLALEDKVYGVHALDAADPEQSNAVGKTGLLEAVLFALYGWHRWDLEDQWITRGAPAGSVQLTLSDGTTVRRSRVRGKSTQLVVDVGGQGKAAKGKPAQELVDKLVGLSLEDLLATRFFAQKRVDKLVTMSATERTEVVNSWLELGALERCEQNARDRLSQLVAEDAELQNKLTGVREPALAILAQHGLADHGDPLEELNPLVDEKAQALINAKLTLAQARLVPDAQEYDRIAAEGFALKAEAEQLELEAQGLVAARAAAQKALLACEASRSEVRRLGTLCSGTFSGTCPINGAQCPIADSINAEAERHEPDYQAAIEADRERGEDLAQAHAEHTRLEAAASRARSIRAKMDAMREQLRRLQPAKRAAGALPAAPEGALEEAEAKVEQARQEHHAVKQARDLIAQAEAAMMKLRDDRDVLGERIAVHREAVAIFRQARRVVAEGQLGEIEHGANDLLAEVGVPLTVAVRWAREAAKDLATQCDACGAPYPHSQKVKQCAACAAPRGKKMIEKLELELSDRSGAYEDLAGIAVQLSAGNWLVAKRRARWSVVVLDEPLAHLDQANRRRLAVHVAAMLSRSCAQALVVSHDPASSAVLPGRVTVKRALDKTLSLEAA
jgi:hypothetical protein